MATWNVNSIRTRVEQVTNWIIDNDIDVLLIQETKCKDEQFPALMFASHGYEIATCGYNQWNGVAIASRIGLDQVKTNFPNQPGFSKDTAMDNPPIEARAIFATCGSLEVASLYVPNGRGLDDPHYNYKLDWLTKLAKEVERKNQANPQRLAVYGGDWNVAPLDEDVWDPEFFRDKTHTSIPERKAFQQFLNIGLHDTVRRYTDEKIKYTYWDYTQLRFQKNEGMRIDFLLTTEQLDQRVTTAFIDKKTRYGKGVSDHVPVAIEIVTD